jgi:hypothetical protein
MHSANPIVILTMFLVIALNMFGQLAHPSCNFALRILKMLVEMALKDRPDPVGYNEAILDRFPTDIRTARKSFALEPSMTIYATCPTCSCIYPPTIQPDSKLKEYPTRCQYRQYRNSPPCGRRLTKMGVQDGECVRIPIRPFAYQNFPSYIARFLCRPGIEDSMEQTTKGRGCRDTLSDIWDGHGIQ